MIRAIGHNLVSVSGRAAVVGMLALTACSARRERPADVAPVAQTDTAVFVAAAAPAPSAPLRTVYLDDDGVIRWRDDDAEVLLFGANYTIVSSGDFRAAGYLTDDRSG